MKKIKLGNKWVGEGEPCYIIAEIGILFSNFEEAKRLIDSAIEIGVDAVKFQTFEADTVTTKNNYFDMNATGKISQYELLKKVEPPKDLQIKIAKYANERGMTIFSAPSHMKDLEIMRKMELPIYKIGSDLSCHIPLLKEIAKDGKPIIISTGMCTLEEVRKSVDAILSSGNDQIAIMHCVSDYPSKIEEANLNAIITMKKEFGLPVGFSDHTIGTLGTLAAAIMGADLIERHFKDPRNSSNVDDIHALTKEDFASLIKSIRTIEQAKGDGIKVPTKSEKKNLLTNRVSIVSIQDIKAGDHINEKMIDIRRPGTGIQPIYFDKIIGMKAKISITKETPLTFDMLEP